MSSYQASRDDELSFVKGAVVRVKKKYGDGWWLVRYNGGEGLVPGALFHKFDRRQSSIYIKGIRRKYRRTTSKTIIPTIKPNWMLKDELESPEGESKAALYLVVDNYSSSESNGGEIVLKKGTVVTALDKKDHGWWFVEDRHGRRGWAPATYLKPTNRDGRKKRIVGTPHTVVQSHTAEQEDELTADQGTIVTVIWAADDGWWMVRNKETRKEGLIPSICLKKAELEDTCTLDMLEECREEDEEQYEQEEKGPCAEDFDYGSSDELGAVDGDIAVEECYVAAVDYVAKDIDELDLHEGETVCIIDGTANDYWYVNVDDGKEGWVPSNVLDVTTVGEELSASTHGSRRSSCEIPGYSGDEDVDQCEVGGHTISTGGTRRNTLSPMVLRRSKSAQAHTGGVAQEGQRRRGNSIGECNSSENARGSDAGQSSPKNNRAYLSPSARRRYKRPDFTQFKREVPPLPTTLNKLGHSAPDVNHHSPYTHKRLGRSASEQPQMNGLKEEASWRRGSEPPLPTIMIGNKSLDELEEEAAEAERTALEAQRRAQALRELVQRARSWSDSTENSCALDT